MGRKPAVKSSKKKGQASDGIDWKKYNELLANGVDAEDALRQAKKQ